MTKRQVAVEAKKQFWKEHVQAWHKSNIEQTEYCRSHGLKRHTFWYWKKKFSKDNRIMGLSDAVQSFKRP